MDTPQRESRPFQFSAAFNCVEMSMGKLEELLAKIEGGPGVANLKPEINTKAPPVSVREIMEGYPERLRKIRDRIEVITEKLEAVLF